MVTLSTSAKSAAPRRAGGRRYRPQLESLEARAVLSAVAFHVHSPIAIAEVARPKREIGLGNEPGRGVSKALERSEQRVGPAQPTPGAAPFQKVRFYPASSHPSAVVSFSIKGVPYLAVLNRDYPPRGGVTILEGDGDGGFDYVHRYDLGGRPNSLAVGNLNGNAALFVGTGEGYVDVLMGNGDGSFTFGEALRTPDHLFHVAVAQLAGSQYNDVITAGVGPFEGGSVEVFRGQPGGTFGPPKIYGVRSRPKDFAIGDFNGDGFPDIAVTSEDDKYTAIWTSTDQGRFQFHEHLYIGYDPTSITAGDFGPNGTVALAIGGHGYLSVFDWNSQLREFSKSQALNVEGTVRYLTSADLNDDGKVDLVMTLPSTGKVAVAYNTGDDLFGQPMLFPAGHHPLGVTVGDVDNNDIPDLITANQHGGNVGVLLGTGAPIG
jgi:hypothetical protein